MTLSGGFTSEMFTDFAECSQPPSAPTASPLTQSDRSCWRRSPRATMSRARNVTSSPDIFTSVTSDMWQMPPKPDIFMWKLDSVWNVTPDLIFSHPENQCQRPHNVPPQTLVGTSGLDILVKIFKIIFRENDHRSALILLALKIVFSISVLTFVRFLGRFNVKWSKMKHKF